MTVCVHPPHFSEKWRQAVAASLTRPLPCWPWSDPSGVNVPVRCVCVDACLCENTHGDSASQRVLALLALVAHAACTLVSTARAPPRTTA